MESSRRLPARLLRDAGQLRWPGGRSRGRQCISKELDGLIHVRRPVPVLESGLKAVGKDVEKPGSMRMARRTEPTQLNRLINVRRDAPLLESGLKAVCKVVERDDRSGPMRRPAAGIAFKGFGRGD